jgi:soluble lytic murein transglycosylase
MPIKIIFLIKITSIILLFVTNLFATEATILPLKKPTLDESVKAYKLSKDIIKPKSKPIKTKLKENQEEKEIVKKKEKKMFFCCQKLNHW